jgi:hypothetical protein
MRHAQLVLAHDLVIANLFPLTQPDQVLRFQELVSQEARVRDHEDEFFSGHGFPDFVKEGAIVDLFSPSGKPGLFAKWETKDIL